MNTPVSTDRYKNHRFPAEIISHGVWLYYRSAHVTTSWLIVSFGAPG
jgi:transposase-like protein